MKICKNMQGYRVKIICGKRVRVPEETFSLHTTKVLPPISSSGTGNYYDKRSDSANMAQRISYLLSNVSSKELQRVKQAVQLYDEDGCVETYKLERVFLRYMMLRDPIVVNYLIRKYSDVGPASYGRVRYTDLFDYLEGCISSSDNSNYSGRRRSSKLDGNRQPLYPLTTSLSVAECHSTDELGSLKSVKKSTLNQASSSIQTQTNTGAEPIITKLRGKRIRVYPSDEYTDINDDEPDEKLQLEWVYGYRGKDCRNNLAVLMSGELIYFIAAVVVIYNPNQCKQRHYTQHTDDIKSLAVHPDGVTVATGQTAGHDKVQGEPHVRVWDSNTLETCIVIGLGHFERAVIAVGFSGQDDSGKHMVTVDDDNNHTITVWEWGENKRVTSNRGHQDQVLVGCFTRFKIPDRLGNDRLSVVTCGKQHITFWTLEDDDKLSSNRGRFRPKHRPPLYISCVTFANNGNVLTGDTNGNIFVWQEGSNEISSSVTNAHEGPVYTLLVIGNGHILSGGGKDGHVRSWKWKTDSELIPSGAVELNMRLFGVTGIRTLAVHGATLYIGTTTNCIWTTQLSGDDRSPLLDAGRADRLTEIIAGHSDELWGLATHPSLSRFVTAGSDKTVRLWDPADHKPLWASRPTLAADARKQDRSPEPNAADIHPSGDTIAVGYKDGSFVILDASNGDVLCYRSKCAREKISELKYSPDGQSLAVASHDNNIYIYKLLDGGRSLDYCGKCQGHTSFVSHIDWSADSAKLQSTSGDYELLFWDAKKCEHLTSPEELRNTPWATQNCILGYPVAGIWPDGADGTDINATDRSHNKRLVATGDDFGDVNLFRHPCVNRKSKPQVAKGHSAHVTCVRFLCDDCQLISTGGRDASIMQWKLN